jgi:hypothetical protein
MTEKAAAIYFRVAKVFLSTAIRATAIQIAPYPSVRLPGDHPPRQNTRNVVLAVIERILYIRMCEIHASASGRSAPQVRVLSPKDDHGDSQVESSIDIREINHELDGS